MGLISWMRGSRGSVGICLALGCGSLTGSGVASADPVGGDNGSGASQTVTQALQLELTGPGLGAVADVVRTKVLGNIEHKALPDMDQRLFGGIHLMLSDLNVSVDFESLQITPTNGGLAVKIGMHQLKLAVGNMALEKTILGATLAASCSRTEFDLASQGTVYLSMLLHPSIEDTDITATADHIYFPVSSDNYSVQGPAACSGFIIGQITRHLLHDVLVLARPLIQDVVRFKLRDVLPAITAEINAQAHISAAFNLPSFPTLPARTARFDAFPSSLTLDKNGMKVVLGITISRVTTMPFALTESAAGGPVRFGSLGLNPGLITAAFNVLWPEGNDYTDLSDKLKDSLDINAMSSIWPDLLKIKTTSKDMKAFLRLAAPPQLSADATKQDLAAYLPNVEVKFQVNVNNQWQDYYVVNLDVHTGAQAAIRNDSLAVSTIADSSLQVKGHWAEGYKPQDPQFNQDTAVLVFSSILNLIYAQGPIFTAKLPTIDIAGHAIKLAKPHVDGPFVAVDFNGK